MGPKQISKGRARRTHSLGGCATCRRRHVKCDQVQPFCLTCKAVGVTCEGYSSNVQWMQPSNSSEKGKRKADTGSTRRHLYTEKTRASMSTELTAALSSNSVDASLTEIDSWSKNSQPSNADNLAVGPFGVLNFGAPAQTVANDATVIADEARVETEPTEELFPTPSTLDPLMSLDDSLQWADLFALDFGNEFLMQQDPFGPIAQDLGPNFGGLELAGQQSHWSSDMQPSALGQNSASSTLALNALPNPVSPFHDTGAPSTSLLHDTHFLLRHFQDNVINAMAGVPYTLKSPWKSQNLASAVQALASMTYLGEKTVKHANAANLYGLMSCSARHLASMQAIPNSPSSCSWPQLADWALEKAKLHLGQSMRTEFQGLSRAKYKDQLMATMATIAACQLSGNQTEVRRYMLEAERVLRLRGLAKREISRKARLLHHIYTWMRIVGESTYVIHDYNSYAPVIESLNPQHQKRPVRQPETDKTAAVTNPYVNHNARLDDFLRIETQHDSDLEIDETKEASVGLHDIHLEDSRADPASMYLQIYGIPETWLSLVSQTTRLANVMDTVKVSNKETNVTFQNALQKRAARLENMICSFAFKTAPPTPVPVDTNNPDVSTVLPNHYMCQALNSALVIFFYRRIRDVNPWILQSHVDDVIKALENYDKALLDQNMAGPGTAWAAFMAGCEAIAPHRRETLLRWIQIGRAKSGMQSFDAAEDMMLNVWKKRDDSNGPSPRTARSTGSSISSSRGAPAQWTWVDTSREKNTWLMLC